MGTFIQQVLNSLLLGSTYAMIAIGFTVVFGVMNLLNFSYPNVFALSGFIVYAGSVSLKLPFIVTIGLVLAIGIVLGSATELICFRRSETRQDDLIAPALSSAAFGLLIASLISKIWGGDPLSIGNLVAVPIVHISKSIQLAGASLVILAVSILLLVATDVVIQRTRIGYALRAVAESRMIASVLGINVRRTVLAAFVMSSALAMIAGILLSLRLRVADPNVGLTYGLRAMAAMVIGGLGNIRGAMVAGMLLGFVDCMTLGYLSQQYSDPAAWVVLLVILVVRPNGLFGVRLQRQTV